MPDGGLGNSGSFEVTKNGVLKILVKKEQLPLQIDFRWNLKQKRPGERHPFFACWGHWRTFCRYRNFVGSIIGSDSNPRSEYLFDEDESWFYQKVILTESSADYYVNGMRTVVEIFEQEYFSGELFIRFCDFSKMDDFSIKTIAKAQVHNLQDFIDYNKSQVDVPDPKTLYTDVVPNYRKKTALLYQKFKECKITDFDEILKSNKF